jgi:hypothetical protein
MYGTTIVSATGKGIFGIYPEVNYCSGKDGANVLKCQGTAQLRRV